MAKTILIVDDEPDVRAFLAAFLEDHGYVVCTAADPAQGLALLRDRGADLLLLDLQMPGSSGLGLYVAIREADDWRRLPVIIVTGLSSFDLFDARCRPLPPPAAILEKPIDRAALLDAVRRVLG